MNQNFRKFKKEMLKNALNLICELNFKPYIAVVYHAELNLPVEIFSKEGVAILCISVNAVRSFIADDNGYYFDMTISGKPYSVFIPYELILSLFTKSEEGISIVLPTKENGDIFKKETPTVEKKVTHKLSLVK